MTAATLAALRVLHRDRRRRVLLLARLRPPRDRDLADARVSASSTPRSALLVVDLGWYVAIGVSGRDALAFFVVAAICVYVGVTTWREQRSVL